MNAPANGSAIREGTVKFFNQVKGWGFISIGDGERDVFVHKSSLVASGLKGLVEDDRVRFRVMDDGKGPKAIEIKRL